MSRQPNPTLIGAFVLGALALLVAGVAILGGTRWFGDSQTYVAYFRGSVTGLRVGAPVDFRGVTIGEVTDIALRYDAAADALHIPVTMALRPEQMAVVGEEQGVEDRTALEELIARGLRAQLQVQSIVTGLLFVQLDFFPRAPLRLVGAEGAPPEIPTIASTREQLEQTLAEVAPQVPELLGNVNQLLTQVSSGLGGSQSDFEQILDDLAAFTASLNRATPALDRLVEDAGAAVGAIRATATTADAILEQNRATIDATLAELQSTLDAVRRMVDQVNTLVAENREGLRDFTTGGLYEITGLAQDAQRMVDQITRVAEDLERDPARFFFGERGVGVRPEE
jgi:paraquat-inducible protein B